MRKSCDSLDRVNSMEILRGYGLGDNLQRLLQSFWCEKEVVSKAGRFYRLPFIMDIVVNQGVCSPPHSSTLLCVAYWN